MMGDTLNSDTLNAIAAKIENLTDAALNTRSFYRLSDLGIDLAGDLLTLKILTKKPLSDFIRDRLADKFSIILSGQYKNVQALVRNANSPNGSTPVILVDKHDDVNEARQNPRYNYRFWAAFSVPYREGKRMLNLKDFTFQDMPSDGTPLEGHLEIPHDLIAPSAVKDRDKLITENISKWIDANGLEKSDFYAVRVQKDVLASTGLSVLEAFIAALDQRQLSNNSLTLDVIAALMRKRV
jgi:hypothetical protein